MLSRVLRLEFVSESSSEETEAVGRGHALAVAAPTVNAPARPVAPEPGMSHGRALDVGLQDRLSHHQALVQLPVAA